MKTIDLIAIILLIIGGLVLGLIGFFGFDLFGTIFGGMVGITRVIYALIGLSAVYKIVLWSSIHKRMKKK